MGMQVQIIKRVSVRFTEKPAAWTTREEEGFFTTDFTDFTDGNPVVFHPCRTWNPWLHFFGCGLPRCAF
jgi:hypothetical protein